MMNNPSAVENSSPDSMIRSVGRRLAFVRKQLAQLHGEQHWTQTAVAQQTGLTQNIITRLEQGEGGKFESLVTVIHLYEAQGYNPAWLTSENNQHLSKFTLPQTGIHLSDQQRKTVIEFLDKTQQALNDSLAEIRQKLQRA